MQPLTLERHAKSVARHCRGRRPRPPGPACQRGIRPHRTAVANPDRPRADHWRDDRAAVAIRGATPGNNSGSSYFTDCPRQWSMTSSNSSPRGTARPRRYCRQSRRSLDDSPSPMPNGPPSTRRNSARRRPDGDGSRATTPDVHLWAYPRKAVVDGLLDGIRQRNRRTTGHQADGKHQILGREQHRRTTDHQTDDPRQTTDLAVGGSNPSRRARLSRSERV
jgi:hypothetical protein